jgi:hypothetical protein
MTRLRHPVVFSESVGAAAVRTMSGFPAAAGRNSPRLRSLPDFVRARHYGFCHSSPITRTLLA